MKCVVLFLQLQFNFVFGRNPAIFNPAIQAGSAATSAESLKRRKYALLDSGYIFEPFGVETLESWGPGAHKIYRDFAERLKESTRDQNAGLNFAQRLSVAIQRRNAASILATFPSGYVLEILKSVPNPEEPLCQSKDEVYDGASFSRSQWLSRAPTEHGKPFGVGLRLVVASQLDLYSLVGGKNVSILEAPFQANYADICGAVIIHARWVLTTAHCGAEGTFIRAGSVDRLSGAKVQVLRHILHPGYVGHGRFDYDIQLLKLYKKLRFWRHLKSIVLAASQPQSGESMKVFGWGYQVEKGDYSSYLQMIEVLKVPITDCEVVRSLLDNEVELTSRMICAKGSGQDACQGDSGGAAISSSSGLLVGLSSFGYGCGRDLPGVYIGVTDHVRSWIEKHTTD